MNFTELWTRLVAAAEILFPKGIDLGKIWQFGAWLSLVMSWSTYKSVVLALFHGGCSWVYVLYYVLCSG